uniref:Uncharacterized protein n=1 Tax=Anguilla anguilla TaxID=7936 RepID=A0A0E9UM38_ANGAN
MKQKIMLNGKCHYSVQNMISSNNTFHVSHANGTVTGTFLPAGPDSLVLRLLSVDVGDIIESLYIFGMSTLEAAIELTLYVAIVM